MPEKYEMWVPLTPDGKLIIGSDGMVVAFSSDEAMEIWIDKDYSRINYDFRKVEF